MFLSATISDRFSAAPIFPKSDATACRRSASLLHKVASYYDDKPDEIRDQATR